VNILKVVKDFFKGKVTGIIYTDENRIGWGHSFYFQNPTTIVGWLPRKPERGDGFHVPMKSGKVMEYLVTSVRYPAFNDPPDMFFATVKKLDYVQ